MSILFPVRDTASISICIPAYNEERSIERTLKSVYDAIPHISEYTIELLLCANACRDKTVEAAEAWAGEINLRFKVYDLDRSPHVQNKENCFFHILVTSAPGKSNAWNHLKKWASGSILIFIDADIAIHPQSFLHLVQAFRIYPEKRAAGGIVLAPSTDKNLLYTRMRIKMKEFATKNTPYLNGPLYAIRKDAVESMPESIIHEDAYLTMTLGAEHIVTVPQALAYQVPPNTYTDYYKRRIRDNLSDLRLHALYGQRYADFRMKTKDMRTKKQRESVLSAWEKFAKRGLFLQTWLCKILDRKAKQRAKEIFSQGGIVWLTCNSTKG